jgi:flagellar biosynthetic protein FliS
MYSRAARLYKKVDLNSASKVQILDRLYLRLLKDIADACVAIQDKDLSKKASNISHAGRIVTELKAALDFSVSPDLCENLTALYAFVERQFLTASRTNEVKPLEDARKVIQVLRDSFKAAAEKCPNPKATSEP